MSNRNDRSFNGIPPKPIATMTLVSISDHQKILAGHDRTDEAVYVLRKDDRGEYHLFHIPVDAMDQSLRSFIAADQSEAMELSKAIRATMGKPKRKPRRKAK